MRKLTVFLACSGALLLVNSVTVPTASAIECKGRFQYNSAAGGWIVSPFCADSLIAAVARQNGMNVTDRQVRVNPSIKQEACRFAGSDTRISDLCAGHLHEDQNGSRN